MQTFTFYASEDKLDNRGNYAASKHGVSIDIIFHFPPLIFDGVLDLILKQSVPFLEFQNCK